MEAKKIPQEFIDQAQELARLAEVLPGGPNSLAERIWQCSREKRKMRVKLGVDPTSSDLHLGHAVQFRKLKRFQDFGHQVVIIIGGATAQIGDPSGRNATRPPLTREEVDVNAKTYLDQMGLVLDLDKAELTNNADWLSPLTLTEVLKLAGRVTLNQLIAKEGFGERLDKQLPVGFHELFYPLMQGYDSIAIRADIEFGGTDQRFNILQGRELQPFYGQEPQLAFLLPLLEGTDGVQKMSKSYGNYIGLKDAPEDMFGKCMRIPDTLIVKYFELTTALTGAEVDQIKNHLESGGNPKDAKEKLGQEVVHLYHGKEASEKALEQWRRVHSERQVPEDMPSYVVSSAMPLFRVVAESKLASGTGESKRLIAEGAVRLDGNPITNPNEEIHPPQNGGMVLQVGRRKFVRLVSR